LGNAPLWQLPWPRRLDVDYDILHLTGSVHIILNDVFAGGVGESMGLRRGDVIVRANDRDLRSDNHFREVVLSQTPPTFLVANPQTGQRRMVRFAPNVPVGIFDGVSGDINPRGEFEVGFITRDDPVTSRLQLRRGDLILAVNDQRIRSVNDIQSIAANSPGPLVFIILRIGHGQPQRIIVQ
jgi:membrane-associated protease RseP (regulator of RpoE activity)